MNANDINQLIAEIAAISTKTQTAIITNLHNTAADILEMSSVKKFENRATAIRRANEIADKLKEKLGDKYVAIDLGPVDQEPAKGEADNEKVAAKAIKKLNDAGRKAGIARVKAKRAEEKAAKAERKAKEASERKGRDPKIPGSVKLMPVRDKNPRREGTHGYRSYEIVLNSPGITVADYLSKGGRRNDLQWDLDHNFIRTESSGAE